MANNGVKIMSKFKAGDKVVNVANPEDSPMIVVISTGENVFVEGSSSARRKSELKLARCSQYDEHHEPAEIVETEIAMKLITSWDKAWNQVLSIKQK